jgi:hypothetical protein
VPLTSLATSTSGVFAGLSPRGTKWMTSAPESGPGAARVWSRRLVHEISAGDAGRVTSNVMTPPCRSSPTNAYVRPLTFPTPTPSGSGPLLSLRPSNALSSFDALEKLPASEPRSVRIVYSIVSPLSHTRCPDVVQIDADRPRKA